MYEMEVTLPSAKSKLYPNNPELHQPITLKMVTTAIEKQVLANFTSNSMDKLLELTTNIDPSLLTNPDKQFLLFKLREFSYGNEYHSTYTCPHCHVTERFKFSLSDIKSVTLDESYEDPITITLPHCKDIIKLSSLTSSDLKQIRDVAQDMEEKLHIPHSETYYTHVRAKRIKAINGEVVSLSKAVPYLENLSGRDRAYIDNKSQTLGNYGLESTVDYVCPHCNKSFKLPYSMDTEFFQPEFDGEGMDK